MRIITLVKGNTLQKCKKFSNFFKENLINIEIRLW